MNKPGRIVTKLAVSLLLLVCALSPALAFQANKEAIPTGPALPPGYKIAAGDVLQVNVWKEAEASVQGVVVRPDGKISMPLIKEIEVQGLTPVELEKLLSQRLTQFIHTPDVTVTIREIHGRKAYLIGAVKKEGPVVLLSNMTILQLLAEAGGLTDYAKRKKIYILRKVDGKEQKLMFDYSAVIKGEHMEQNIPVMPEDTIIVPQ
jgi:polysaccharide export outer membrane protein